MMNTFEAFVGLAEMIQQGDQASSLRQAVVVRPDGNSVWVRFTGESATAPETQLATTQANVPAGTAGVVTVSNGKGVFIATGLPRIKSLRAVAGALAAVSTAGTVAVSGAALTFTNLEPGRTYEVEWLVSMVFGPQASGTNRAALGVRVTHAGGTTDEMFISSYVDMLTTRQVITWRWGGSYVATAAGEISTVPIVTWNAGTVSVLATRNSTTVS